MKLRCLFFGEQAISALLVTTAIGISRAMLIQDSSPVRTNMLVIAG
jgi:hypothetical protein